MAGDILIVDNVATNRIVLKVKLLAAQYRVRPCASIEEARAEVEASVPDLILLDTCAQPEAALTFCRDLKAHGPTSIVPVVATGGFVTPRDRVNALEAGADDVLTKPFDDHILQARIRSLLRARDARDELRMREDTRTALGFAEASSAFAPASQITLVSEPARKSVDVEELAQKIGNAQVSCMSVRDAMRGKIDDNQTDLYLLDFRAGLSDDKTLFQLLSELRSQSHTRHAGLLALLPSDAHHAAAMALDLGANDLVYADVDFDEIQHRCAVLLQSKHEADALRQTVESGLTAAITDPLTGLFNRRYAMPHLQRLSEESRKNGRQFAVMVLDLDHFKSVNDTYGHAAGDEILVQVAQRLRDNLRAVDLLARIGGEEFLVAIPNSDVVHARTAAERLCGLVRNSPFYVGGDRHEVKITMSVGVSLNDGLDETDMSEDMGELVNAADLALYAAKTGGRNKVSLAAA